MNDETQVVEDAETSNPEAQEAAEQVKATGEPEPAQAEGDKPSEEAAASEEPEQEKPKRKKGAEHRISELVREREEAKREADRLRQQLEGKGGVPNVEEFDNYDDYLVARAEWSFEQKQQERAAQQQQVIEQEMAQQRAAEWSEKVEEAKSQYADFEAVAFNANLPISDAVAQIIQQSEKGPDIAYALGKNPQRAAELSQMTPTQAAIAIGRMESSLPQPKKVSDAPEPITPIAGKHDAGEVNPSKLDTARWMEWRRSQLSAGG